MAGRLQKRNHRKTSSPLSPSSSSSSMALIPPTNPLLVFRRASTSFIFIVFLIIALLYVSSKPSFHVDSAEIYSVDVVNEFPHDPNAFTQGLLYAENDTLFESTGLYGHSSVRRVLLHTGEVLDIHRMDDSYFGEGLTLLENRLFQVTWLKKTGFIYDRNNFSKLGTFSHQMKDGWGLATDGKILFGSDGTSLLYQIDPHTLKVTKNVAVKYNGHSVSNLNELEYINGEVWANVWQTDCIARISPQDGTVLGWILLEKLREGLLSSSYTGIDVLNGIAWDGEKKRLFVTGKLWPKLFEIKLRLSSPPSGISIEDLCLPRS